MRQNDGSEILGPNDPRNLVIGIIHVSPNDDRQSVITAITTQEKLGRDQIVLDLPAQNKSFKSAVDFEGLRQMASEIEATIVLVAPEKSKIANLARKENFTVYPSLDELTAAEFPPMEPDGNEVIANGKAQAKAQEATPVEDDEQDHVRIFPVTPPPTAATASTLARKPKPPAKVQDAPASQAQVPTAGLPEVQQPPAEKDEAPTNPALAAVTSVPAADDARPVEGQLVDEDEPVPAQGGSQPAPLAPGAGALVPSQPQLPVYYEPIEPSPHRSWRGWIITAVIVVTLIALGAVFYGPALNLFFPPTATVTIVPASQQLQHTYQITAVLGVPDPSKDQVDARALYADSQTQSSTVKATGQGHTSGQQARGTLTFYNASTAAQTIQAGTVIFDNKGNAIVNDHTITLPALDPSVGLGSVSDSAHTINVGSSQNIPAYDLNNQLCCGGTIYVSNTTDFVGGEDPQTFTYVQQSDIDGVVQSLSTPETQQATMTLQGQVRSNEKPAGTPRCAPQVRSDHQAGDLASSVTVSVTVSCIGEVYDMQAVQVLAARKLTQDAGANPGPAYVQVGAISTQVTQSTPDNHGNVPLVVNARGVWAYQFSHEQLTQLARLIAGHSSQDAKNILLGQAGVHSVTITLTGVNVTTIPDNTSHITIHIEAVPGLNT
jgi:VCBS repeat-containing protein